MRIALVLLAIAAVCAPQTAAARSPLKPADMKTIRRDAHAKAVGFARQYRASRTRVTCAKRTPFSARCRIHLVDVRAGSADCTVTLVYVVTPQRAIEGNVASDGCA